MPGTKRFAVWWTALLLLHSVNVAYYVGATLVYTQFQHSYVYLQLKQLSIGIDNSQYKSVSTIHALLAAIHAVFVGLMVIGSVHARRLVFLPKCLALGPRSGTDTVSRRGLPRRLTRTLSLPIRLLVARDGPLGVDSAYFDHITIVREIIETALQTHQLYRMTQLLPRPWLIRFYLALLVVNCWALPILHRQYQSHPLERRTICLLCDAVLDILSSIGVSSVIFVTYWRQYNDQDGFGFPYTNWFQDDWVANMQQEFQIMLVTSWSDMFSRVVFSLGLFSCMDAIKDMLTPAYSAPKTDNPKGGPQAHALVLGPATEPIAVSHRRHRRSIEALVVHTLWPLLFLLWGAAVIVVHGIAESIHTESPCALQIRPWLSGKPGCSLVELNCHLLGSSGHDDTLDAAWNVFDPEPTARLVIRHCPQLHFSTDLLSYRTISGLKVYNSTITDWPSHAAVTAASHPNLRSITLVRTDFPNGELPPGLLSTDFPPRLSSLLTSVTNLERLPDDLDTKWPRGMRLILEYSRLQEIPDTIVRLQPFDFSIAGSAIRAIPPELFEIPGLLGVIAGDTQLQELPRNVTRASASLYVIFLHNTNVSTFWAWMDVFVEYTMHFPAKLFKAYGTPYCRELAEIAQGHRKAFSASVSAQTAAIMDVSTPERLAFARRAVDCEPGYASHFPLGFEDALHALH